MAAAQGLAVCAIRQNVPRRSPKKVNALLVGVSHPCKDGNVLLLLCVCGQHFSLLQCTSLELWLCTRWITAVYHGAIAVQMLSGYRDSCCKLFAGFAALLFGAHSNRVHGGVFY